MAELSYRLQATSVLASEKEAYVRAGSFVRLYSLSSVKVTLSLLNHLTIIYIRFEHSLLQETLHYLCMNHAKVHDAPHK